MQIHKFLEYEQGHLRDQQKKSQERLKKCKEEQEILMDYLVKLSEPIALKKIE